MTNKFTESYAPPCIINKEGNFRFDSKYKDELLEFIQVGLNNEKTFLRSCRAFKHAEVGMSVLYGDDLKKEFKGPSTLRIRKSRRQTREAIANQSDIRQNWQIRTTKPDDPLCADQADDLNNLSKDWWYRLFVDRAVKGAQQYAGGHGTGYMFLWPDYDPLTGEIDIMPNFLDYKSVLVGHIPADNDINKAYRLDLVLEMPLPMAHEKFPDHIGMIKPDTEIPSRMARNYDSGKKIYMGLWDHFAKKLKRKNVDITNPFPCARIYMTFIKDNTINETGKTICMGLPGSHWYYEVPSFINEEGKVNQIGTGTFETKYYDAIGNEVTAEQYKASLSVSATTGVNYKKETKEIFRSLKREECKLFPCGRLIRSCTNGIISDGPPEWGDGTFPVAQFYFDKVAGEFLAFPVAMDSIPIENSANNIFQSMEDSIVGKINPPIGVDTSLPDDIKTTIKALGLRGLIGKGFVYSIAHLQKAIVPLVDHNYFNIGAEAFKVLELLQAMQDYVMGTQDWASAAQLKQTPSEETQEALLRKLGVLSTDQAREQEKSFMQLGRVWLSFAPDVYTLKKRLQILGPNAIKPHYVDYNPNRLEQVSANDNRPKWIKRREHMKNFSVYVSPNSVQERQATQNKLAALQLQKMGNTGITDKMVYDLIIGDDQFNKRQEEYFNEQLKKAKQAATIQAEVAKIMQSAGVNSDGKNSIGVENPLIQQIVEELAARFDPSKSQVGRPPTNNEMPRLESKTRDGVPDVTLASN